ncbi:MAG: LysM peptidoglycan-binding domain-containing protein [Bdellovibrionales bacterium]|nr:LysM peptidoglycan-binding domain-containing protein [Bdellovibrionales bacterium]
MKGCALVRQITIQSGVCLCLLVLLNACSGLQPRYHEVSLGDTQEKIARRYGVGLSDLKEYNAAIGKGIHVGDKIYIPFESIPGWNEGDEEWIAPEGSGSLAKNRKGPSRDPSSQIPRFNWPVYGTLSSHFGNRGGEKHEGIDIAAPKGTQVLASRSGHVIYSGSKISGYGKMVILRHPDTYATVYAHLSKINVKKGDFVSRGQSLGKVGSTGRSTGPHLHFEVRNQRTPTDPLALLPKPPSRN